MASNVTIDCVGAAIGESSHLLTTSRNDVTTVTREYSARRCWIHYGGGTAFLLVTVLSYLVLSGKSYLQVSLLSQQPVPPPGSMFADSTPPDPEDMPQRNYNGEGANDYWKKGGQLVGPLSHDVGRSMHTFWTGFGQVIHDLFVEKHDMNQELFYSKQLVNHFDGSTDTWKHRYYKSTEYFKGPGHPIFHVVGGEGALDFGMMYPFITRHLAPYFGAAVIQIEHRFYGTYHPITGREATVSELLELLTPQQAMADNVQLGRIFKEELGCSFDRTSPKYCPVITVGGSYPGFLSAILRVAHSEYVDISYASSAPLKLYDQSTDQYVYYDIVTDVAEHVLPGCAHAVRKSLSAAKELIVGFSSIEEAVKSMNICVHTVPQYITKKHTLSDEIMSAVGFTFADFDSGFYPPGKELGLYKACQVFMDDKLTPLDKVGKFFQVFKEEEGGETPFTGDDSLDCFDMSVFLPDGENARITTSDWSGSGGGNDGKMWDFQLCTTVIDPIGFSPESMFPPRVWTYEDLTKYCQLRYGKEVTPRPLELVEDVKFDYASLKANVTRILFTNGMQDMWYGGSYIEDVSDSILALNFVNGAHHSDLSHVGPTDADTEDMKEGFVQIQNQLEKWLNDIKAELEAGTYSGK